MLSRMTEVAYRIFPAGPDYKVEIIRPGGITQTTLGFTSKEAAQAWVKQTNTSTPWTTASARVARVRICVWSSNGPYRNPAHSIAECRGSALSSRPHRTRSDLTDGR